MKFCEKILVGRQSAAKICAQSHPINKHNTQSYNKSTKLQNKISPRSFLYKTSHIYGYS